MQLHYVGKNIEVTPALKNFTEEKMQALQKRYQQITEVQIVFHVEKLLQIAEATVHLHGLEIHATSETDDMYKSITALVEKLLNQITKHKEKVIETHR